MADVKWNEQDLQLTFRNHKKQAIQLRVEELLSRGVPSLHFYVMQNSGAIKKLMARLKL